jgi:hypothetical protein
MSIFVDEPPRRLKEQRDQSNLFERLAGQAARDIPRARPLSATSLARIATRIDEPVPATRRRRGYAWAMMTAAFLMGIATAASAQRWTGLRQWLGQITSAEPEKPPAPARAVAKHRAHREPKAATNLPGTIPVEVRAQANPQPDTRPVGPPAPTIESRPAPRSPDRPTGGGEPSSTAASAPARNLRLAYVDRRDPAWPARPTAAPMGASVATGEAPSLPAPTAAPERMATPAPTAAPTVVTAAAPNPPSAWLAARPEARPAPREGGSPQATTHLGQAVRALRVEHSPKTALLLLDRHAEELAGNAFAREALLVRVEAMVALGQHREVLRLLDGTPLTGGAASQALLLMRGQLRAAANRCADALGDFSLVLARTRQPSKQALLGRAACKKQLGDREGARADLERYRMEFPGDGPVDGLEIPGVGP